VYFWILEITASLTHRFKNIDSNVVILECIISLCIKATVFLFQTSNLWRWWKKS